MGVVVIRPSLLWSLWSIFLRRKCKNNTHSMRASPWHKWCILQLCHFLQSLGHNRCTPRMFSFFLKSCYHLQGGQEEACGFCLENTAVHSERVHLSSRWPKRHRESRSPSDEGWQKTFIRGPVLKVRWNPIQLLRTSFYIQESLFVSPSLPTILHRP